MKINSVAVLGAGAVGAYFVYGLADKKDIDFCVVAKGERKERLEKCGITVDDKKQTRVFYPAIKTPEEAHGVDLLLVAVKYTGLDAALEDIRAIAAPNTIVMSLLNGVDSEEKIGTVIDPAQILYSLMRIGSERKVKDDGSSVVTFDPTLGWGVYLGEKGSPEKSGRVIAVEELLKDTPCNTYFMEDIVLDQWNKYISNICFNIPQAVLGLPFGAYRDSEHLEYIRRKLYEESSSVAAAYGITVEDPAKKWGKVVPAARFSTLQDLDAGRHTEIDMFAGVLIDKAREKGISVPFAEYSYHAIKALEEKNDGKFTY